MKNEQKMREHMTALGFAERHAGTALVRRAAAMAAEQPGARTYKEIYPAIAREAGMKPEQVERNMRHAVQSAYAACPAAWAAFCGPRRPTNSEVIARMVVVASED